MKIKRRTQFLMAFLTAIAALAFIACPLAIEDPIVDDPVNDPVDVPVVDPTAPVVNSTVPVDHSTNVALNATINATFSAEMDVATIIAANFSLMAGATAVPGTVSYDAALKTVSYELDQNLVANTTYTATLSVGIKDAVGTSLRETIWSFSTGGSIDTAPPTVVQVLPSNNGTGIAINSPAEATFSEGMDIATITTGNFTLMNGTTPVAGSVIYSVQDKKAVFWPTDNLAYGTLYTATVKTGVKDTSGNALQVNKVWTFTTIAQTVVLGPPPVRLGTAGNFVILAKTAITTVPDSAITGNIGLSPAAESYMTGFSQTKATGYSTCPQVTGYMYAADMTPPTPSNMTVAILDMEAAYTDAAGRSDAAVNDLGAGTVGGLTFAPGLYYWGSNILLTTDIYIDGAANDVWIFQTTGNLIVSSDVKVILSGGAQAKNIFWQVAGYAKLGTGSHLEGNILSKTQINLETGASLNGRALAQTQVTLDINQVTKPAQ